MREVDRAHAAYACVKLNESACLRVSTFFLAYDFDICSDTSIYAPNGVMGKINHRPFTRPAIRAACALCAMLKHQRKKNTDCNRLKHSISGTVLCTR